ncbi:hypothetical protein E1301_Tti005661 [Triplophysa tibetana]|uniref:Uncharacterized protein n=1 Tax=Triplophysa tibetana TaxID=1572043 RepID=A0A5A9NHM8_9TELE|nr:hypothetical protein E1301_Tti005661 [Triplophysa tibetana]
MHHMSASLSTHDTAHIRREITVYGEPLRYASPEPRGAPTHVPLHVATEWARKLWARLDFDTHPAPIPPPLHSFAHATGSVLRCNRATFGWCTICTSREKEMKSGCISALRLQRAARCVGEQGQFLLAFALLSMCFAYGHTSLDSACLQEEYTLVVRFETIQIQFSVIW